MAGRPVKAVFHAKRFEHQQRYFAAMRAGLERHGITVLEGAPHSPEPCDFAVLWSWKQPAVIEAAPHVLVMEATHIRDGNPANLSAASIAWDGLAGRGRYPKADDGGARWRERYGHLMRPWIDDREGYALVIGQVPGDAALHGVDVDRWARQACSDLRALGVPVVYRPHPLGDGIREIPGARPSRGTLEEDLAGACACVTFSSMAAVEAVLAGVPTITMDRGSVAWPVTSHSIAEPIVWPARERWAHDLAWTSWTLEEIAAGEAWACMAPIMEAA